MSKLFISGLLETEEDLEEVLVRTGTGLESIQFSVAENLDHFSRTLDKEKALLQRLGNPALTLHGPFMDLNPMAFDRKIQDVTMERFDQAYEAAAELGAEKIVFHSCMVPTVYFAWGWADRMIEFWNRFLQDKSGIGICMENVLDESAQLFADVIQGVDHPDFGICLDLGHAHCYAKDSEEIWIRKLAGHIRHVHLHDNCGDGDRHLALGEGTIRWKECIQVIQKENPEVTWTIENMKKDDILQSCSIFRQYSGSSQI